MNDTSLVAVNPMTILDRLTAQGVDPDKLGRVIDLVQAWNKDQAVKAFSRAMKACQEEMPLVVEDASNTHTKSTYALLETVQKIAKPVYTRHGFSLSWSEGELKGDLRTVVMLVRHDEGHTETHIGHYPIDGVGAKGGSVMNPLQGTVSAHTYAQRDMMRGLFNLVIAGQDFDGNQHGLTDQETEALNGLIDKARDLGADDNYMQKFWNWIFPEKGDTKKRMAEMSSRDFPRAKEWLEKSIAKAKK